jgi:hypothetical protein
LHWALHLQQLLEKDLDVPAQKIVVMLVGKKSGIAWLGLS